MFDEAAVEEGEESGRFNSSKMIDDLKENQFTAKLTMRDMTADDDGKSSVLQVHHMLGTVNFTFVTVGKRLGLTDQQGIFL